MGTRIAISFEESLLAEIDRLAKKEKRSRSELVREAVRLYIERRDRWDKIFAMGKAAAQTRRLSEQDVVAEIRAYRKSKASRHR